MKIWQKKDGQNPDDMVDRFTVGKDKEFDILLAEYDILGSIAHSKMLAKVGLLSDTELTDVLRGLEEILGEIRSGNFVIEDGAEDVHSQVEGLLTKRSVMQVKKYIAGDPAMIR